ncbi:MAG: LysR substrate-binding domain-containing protein [Bacilli bacterium]
MFHTQSMNLDLIRTFVIVGQSKDFNDAASKLSIDATNVSRHIKSLENIMGTKLINKNSKNYIELTEDGKTLFEGYEKAYNLLFITEKTFKQNKDLNSGKIAIGISNDIEIDILNDKIESFKKSYPDSAFKVINLATKDLFEKLYHYNIDFVIDEKIDNPRKSSGIKMIDLFTEKYCLAFIKDKFNITSINDLNNVPLILPISAKKERKLFEELLNKNEIKKKLSVETANYKSAIDHAKRGIGVALLPINLANETNLSILDLPLSKDISIAYIEENLSPSSKEFLKEFK